MKAVLWDMDGTLVDSEKLWDISMHALYAHMGAVLTPEVRATTVGGSAETVMRIVYNDIGLALDQAAMSDSVAWLNNYTGDLFEQGLPWRPGARELLDGLLDAAIPMALVTNTHRDLAERALKTIGRHYFTVTVCGDEVTKGKPAPDPYLRAAELLGVTADACLAIEDSVTGTASAEAAGAPVLVVPNDMAVPHGPRSKQRDSLGPLQVADLQTIYAELADVART